jgi:hypothetical protein
MVKNNKGLKENGGLVISKFDQGALQPIAQGINQDQAFALTTNDAISSPNLTNLAANTKDMKSSFSIDIAKNIANVVDELSNVAVPTITPQPTTIETSTFNNTNKPSSAATNITSTTNTTNADNSAVIAAINKLTEVMMASGGKEIVMQMNGQTVGKVLTPIMSPMTVREINNTSVSI